MTIRYLWRENPVVRDFLLRDEMAATIARIVGTKTLRFWFDLTFIHNGSTSGSAGAGTPWHHDIAAFSFKGEQLPSLWMAMTETNAERSRLMFIDGSHKTVPGYYRTADAKKPENGEKDGFLDLPDFDAMIANGEVRVITWDCQPGDSIILHPNTIHGALGNSGTGAHSRRVAITTRWLGDDVRFLPFSYTQSLKQLGVVETDLALGARPHGDWFPLVYDETRAAA
jgi:ectoine hydroxylase-related dioxygenase (phytanoyl-CoA dioxygenase family)